jgi:REP element-mobilizing transposase RayT
MSRVVNREFVLGDVEREKFRTLMRIYEAFSGNRVLSYCLMSNHFHILLEVTPMPENGISDETLLQRLRAIMPESTVDLIAAELAEARKQVASGHADPSLVAKIHGRYTYRMHSLSEFMKGLMQRYTQWHNRTHQRSGRLWEDRFKSVIVEDGDASKTMAAYIDLNPVRAGIVKDPADYRWSSYGEAVGGGAKGNGKTARAGLVRALRGHRGVGADASFWKHDVSREYRRMLLAGAVERSDARVSRTGEVEIKPTRKGMSVEQMNREKKRLERKLEAFSYGNMLRCRVRYFTDGAVIGSKAFVDKMFLDSRQRFSSKRKDGARKLRGSASAANGILWSARDLSVRI